MVESMYHLRRINFHNFVTNNNNNNNNKLDGVNYGLAAKGKVAASEEINDGDEPSKNPALRIKSTYILLDKGTKIGRNPELVDVVLNSVFHSNMISRDHSEIFIEHGKYFIQDNSLNGTYVNDYRAPKKPDRQLLKEGDVIKFGHVNGAAIKPGEHAPQQSAEFIFKFEKSIPDNHYFGYTEKGQRMHPGNTRAYMQIYSDRVAPQDSHGPLISRMIISQQTSAASGASLTNNQQQQQQSQNQQSSTNVQSSNLQGSGTTAVNTSAPTIPSTFSQLNQMQTSSASTTVSSTLAAIQSQASMAQLNNAAAAASTIVANHQQQLSNAFAQQQQNQFSAQQQQQLAAAVAVAAQNITASTPSTDDVASQLRQLMAANQDQSSLATFSSLLLPWIQSTNQLYGTGNPAAAAAAAAAFLTNSNIPTAASMFWPNVNMAQWRNALQPNTTEWMQQQKAALVSYSTAMNTASTAASLQQQFRVPGTTGYNPQQQTHNPQQLHQQQQQQQQNVKTTNSQLTLSGNGCKPSPGVVIPPTCLPSTSSLSSTTSIKGASSCNASSLSQQLLPVHLTAAIGVSPSAPTVLLPNSAVNVNSNGSLPQNLNLKPANASNSAISTTTPLSLASLLGTATTLTASNGPFSNAYSAGTSAGTVRRTFSSQQELSAAMAAAAATQQQLKKEEENAASKVASGWPFSIATSSSVNAAETAPSGTIATSSSSVSVPNRGILPPNLVSALPLELRQRVSMDYMTGSASLPVSQRIPIASALAAAAAASGMNEQVNKLGAINGNELQFHSHLATTSAASLSTFASPKNNHVINNNENNPTVLERCLISSPNITFGTPPPTQLSALALKDEQLRSRNSSTSLSTTSSVSSVSANAPSELGVVAPSSATVSSNRPTPLSSLRCEVSGGSRASTPSTCILSPNSLISSAGKSAGFEFKSSLYHPTSHSNLLISATSINSLAAKYFDSSDLKNLTTSTTVASENSFSKKRSQRTNGLGLMKETKLDTTSSTLTDVTKLNADLQQLTAAAVAAAKTTNLESMDANSAEFRFPTNLNNSEANQIAESVKTMECDSSVPSPPKVNGQHLNILVGSNNLADLKTNKPEAGLHSPSISTPSRPCSYQSIPQSPPRAPCPRQQESPVESDYESRYSQPQKHGSSNDSRSSSIQKNFVKSEANEDIGKRKKRRSSESGGSNKSDSDTKEKHNFSKKSKVLEQKPRNTTKRNEVERLLNDLTAGNCSWMYQASRNLSNSNKRESKTGNSSNGYGSVSRPLRLDDRKRREIQKKKSHRLMRQISDESSDGEDDDRNAHCSSVSSKFVSKTDSSDSPSSDDSDTESVQCNVVKKNSDKSSNISKKNSKAKKLYKKAKLAKSSNNTSKKSKLEIKYGASRRKEAISSKQKVKKSATQKRKATEFSSKKLTRDTDNSENDSYSSDNGNNSDDSSNSTQSRLKSPPPKKTNHSDKNHSALPANKSKNKSKGLQNGNKRKSKQDNTSSVDEWNYHDPDQSICASVTCRKPQDENVNWAACDTCDNWFHTVCALGSNVMLDDNMDFSCGCKNGGPAFTTPPITVTASARSASINSRRK